MSLIYINERLHIHFATTYFITNIPDRSIGLNSEGLTLQEQSHVDALSHQFRTSYCEPSLVTLGSALAGASAAGHGTSAENTKTKNALQLDH